MLAVGPLPAAFNLDSVTRTLDESQIVITGLVFVYTALLVIAVTTLALGALRREVGVKLQFGVHVWEVVVELVARAALLCLTGGAVGIIFGRLLCALLNTYFTSLVVRPNAGDAVSVFVIGVGLGMASILALAVLLSLRPSTDQGV